ncbi:MAG: potassium channel protein, partial [Cyanobacteriota bacterium]|nr:potassium channel protein [Cyanobacteriota bacterium]
MRRRRARGQLKLITAPWRGPISALSAVIFAGALGYRITEGWDWGDCLW